MEQATIRTIDELGRVILPGHLLQKLGWATGDKLRYTRTRNSLILSMAQQHEGPRCVMCNRLEREVCINGNDICGSCLQEIIETQNPCRP